MNNFIQVLDTSKVRNWWDHPTDPEYLKSSSWHVRRNLYWERWQFHNPGQEPHCKACKAIPEGKRPDLHHNTYIRADGNESYFDLTPLCEDCHLTLHSYAYSKGLDMREDLNLQDITFEFIALVQVILKSKSVDALTKFFDENPASRNYARMLFRVIGKLKDKNKLKNKNWIMEKMLWK